MKTTFLIGMLLISSTITMMPVTAQENDCSKIDVEIESSADLDWDVCFVERDTTLKINTFSGQPTENKIILQKDIFWDYHFDCSPRKFQSFLNDEYVNLKEEYFEDYRILHVSLEKGQNEILIGIPALPPNPANSVCPGLNEDDPLPRSLSMLLNNHERHSLKKQLQNNTQPDDLICKTYMELIVRPDQSGIVCVTSDTKIKLIERGWSKFQEDSDNETLAFSEGQSWGYIKDISMLDNDYVGMTMSYPTNEAYHEIYPDEHQSIIGNCTEQNGSANLSLLYLKESNTEHNQITFTKSNKTFDDLQCDDAFWQEMTNSGYCGPPSPLIFRPDNIAPSISDAQKKADFVLDVPKYLPEGYTIQKIAVESDGKSAILYVSQSPITDEMNACEFTWRDEGIFLQYSQPSESHDTPSGYLNVSDPRKQKVAINDDTGYAVERWVGDRFGMPIPQQSKILFYMQDENVIIQIHSSLAADELVRIAESMSDPIFNSEIIPDYAHSAISENDNLIPVQIIGDAASQICNKIRMICEDDHTFDAEYDLSAHTATFEQSVSYNRYVLEIMPGEICYKINGDPKSYCSTLYVSYSPIVDGNKSTILFKPLDYWKNMSQEELYRLDEKYGDIFYKELGKMVLKDEIKNELKRQSIENANNDFTLHVAGADESSQVFYKSVINGTDGKSYMFDGGAYYNQIRGLSFEELIFHDNVLDELPLDSLFDDQPVIIFPKDDDNYNPPSTITVNLEDGNDMIFYNGMSVPMKISVYSSEKARDQPEPEWANPILGSAQSMAFSLDGTGLYKWDGRLEPEPSPNDWWPRYAGGTIAAYSNETQNLELEKKLKIAQVFIQNSKIPYSGLSTKNDILKIGFNSAIHEMLPDASEYYTARAYQLVPFDVPIIIEESDWNDRK